MDRRTVLSMTGVTAASALSGTGLHAAAAERAEVATQRPAASRSRAATEPRGRTGVLRRLPTLQVASNQEFLTELRGRVLQGGPETLSALARRRCLEILQEHGIEPGTEVPLQRVIELMERDGTMMASARAWLATQALMWNGLKSAFDANRDVYLSELRAAEKRGPGVLELSPSMVIPAYARHEIHMQPGGYVGDPLAGYYYHYGTANFYMGRNYQDENQTSIAQAAVPPADRKVRRILDIACSCGQLTVALKQRFPDAEVWGLDVAGPMVHYAHMRATDLGAKVNFRQALAEATGFPDGHFDMVTSYILLHEVPNAQNTEIIKEVSRVLRPGGTFYPVDFYTGRSPAKDAYGLFRRWWDHRWNNEVWSMEHMSYDLVGDLRRFGMKVTVDGPAPAGRSEKNLFAVKA